MTGTKTALGVTDLLAIVKGMQDVRAIVQPMIFAARDEERRIRDPNYAGVAHPNTDSAALDRAEALTRRYWQIEGVLAACIGRVMRGREDNVADLLARLERDAEAESPAGYRISTEAFDATYRVVTEEEALDAFALDAGYRDYAGLAKSLGKTVREAKGDLVIEPLSY